MVLINWFSDVKPALHSWDKSCLVMVYNPLLCDSVCWYFIQCPSVSSHISAFHCIFIAEEYFTRWIYHNLPILFLLMDIWVISTFWLLRIVLLGRFMYKSLCGRVYFLLERDLSGISGLCGKFMFNFLRNYQNGCTILLFTINACCCCCC